jgi:serine phosphatase RsbU (regulator of sigma subunit)
MILAFSDGATEIRSAAGDQLSATGFLKMAEQTLHKLPEPPILTDFSQSLLESLHLFRGHSGELEDDITLLTLRRVE